MIINGAWRGGNNQWERKRVREEDKQGEEELAAIIITEAATKTAITEKTAAVTQQFYQHNKVMFVLFLFFSFSLQ